MERFKILLALARSYHSGLESRHSFAPEMVTRIIADIEDELEIYLDSSMSVLEKIKWFECL